MKKVVSEHHPKKRIKSFKYAFNGLFHALLNEANFRIQVVFAATSIALGFYFKISNIEWGLLTISLGFLLSAELVNTVVEEVIDYLFKDIHPIAKIIKDLSAGFVLTSAITTLIIFLLIFGNELSNLL